METGLTVDGNWIVVTVGPSAVMVVTNGVRKTPETSPLVCPGPLPQFSGGPRVTSGQGGIRTVRVVVPPSPSGSGTGIGLRSTLGLTVMALLVWPWVTFTLEYCMPSVVTRLGRSVTVVVFVMNVVTTAPPTVVSSSAPYSREVVYDPGSIVVLLLRELVGKTSRQGGEHSTSGSS